MKKPTIDKIKKRIKIGKAGWFVEIIEESLLDKELLSEGKTTIGDELLVDSKDVEGFAKEGARVLAEQIERSILAFYKKLKESKRE